MITLCHPARSKGMTLVELMVGLAVGLFVSIVVVSLFASTRTLASVGNSSTRMSENARLAMDVLHRDLRSAGFQGCKPQLADPPISTLSAGNGAFLDTGSSGLAGHHGTGSSFTPALSAALSGLTPAPSADSDTLSMRVPVEPLSLGLTAAMTVSTGAPQVGAGTIPAGTIVRGSIVLIGNCKGATIFQVTEGDPAATGALTHIVDGTFVPGNSTTDLQQAFRGDAAVWQLQTHHYYVAPSVARPGTRSLWRYAFPPSAGRAEPDLAEVAAGIERMAISYGIAAPPDDRNLNRYVSAENVPDWNLVVAVRVQLLAATTKDGMSRSQQTVSFDGADVIATDRRLRSALTEVVTLRNRAQ